MFERGDAAGCEHGNRAQQLAQLPGAALIEALEGAFRDLRDLAEDHLGLWVEPFLKNEDRNVLIGQPTRQRHQMVARLLATVPDIDQGADLALVYSLKT